MLIERLSKESGLRVDRLQHFAKTASKRYYVFQIKKANGGYRQIAHPSRALKAVHRWLNSRYFAALPVHSQAVAYRRGLNIRDNASQHARSMFTLRIDFEDFFHNFSTNHITAYLNDHKKELGIDSLDVEFISNVSSRNGGLTIGSPISPVLTNAMMFDFDEQVHTFCRDRNLIYTRYADDLFISANEPGQLAAALHHVGNVSRTFRYARLVINEKKTRFLSRRYRRTITGLVITPEGNVSVGRARKREIKSLLHSFTIGSLDIERLDYLKGLLSFVSDVEPSFRRAMVEKYGEDVLSSLFENSGPVSSLVTLDPHPKPA